MAEFKICNGVMLLLHNYSDDQTLPMTLINVHSGEELMKFKFSKISKEIEFLE